MSKLIIPAAELIGTPLTTEELKAILAGYSITKVCTCSYERGGPVDEYGNTPHYTQVISGVTKAEDCEAGCASLCNGSPTYKCIHFDWTFVTTESGSGPQ